jgi:hypothetical protein
MFEFRGCFNGKVTTVPCGLGLYFEGWIWTAYLMNHSVDEHNKDTELNEEGHRSIILREKLRHFDIHE